MGVSTQLLIYASQLRKGEYAKGWGDTPEIEDAVSRAARDRADLAEGFCRSAEELVASLTASEMDRRNATSRAYYACHHAMRACALEHQSGDEPDHRGAITAFARIVTAEQMLRETLGDASQLEQRVDVLMHQRHLADYHPYGSSYPREAPADFAEAAADAVTLARSIVNAVQAFLRNREGDGI